jgi:hypothetical protein
MGDAVRRQCVDHGVHHCGGRGDRTNLAAPFDAERIVPTTGTLRRHCEPWQVIGTRYAIIHKRAGEELAARRIIDAVLAQRLAGALNDATVDLALDDHWVQHDADIIDGGVGNERQLASLGIDLDLRDMAAAREGEIQRIEKGGLFEAGFQDVERKPVRREIGRTATSPNVMLRSVPLTVNLPAANSMSCSLASSR